MALVRIQEDVGGEVFGERQRAVQMLTVFCGLSKCAQGGAGGKGGSGEWRWSSDPASSLPGAAGAAAGWPGSPRPHAEARRGFTRTFQAEQIWPWGFVPHPAGNARGSAGKRVVGRSAKAFKTGFFSLFHISTCSLKK